MSHRVRRSDLTSHTRHKRQTEPHMDAHALYLPLVVSSGWGDMRFLDYLHVYLSMSMYSSM